MAITNTIPGPYVPVTVTEGDSGGKNSGFNLEYQEPPINRLPPPLAEYIDNCAEAIGCDPALIALPALAACAAAIGDSRAVQMKAGWIEYPVIWALVVAPSGALKTPALKAAMEGLEAAQRKAFQGYDFKMKQFKDELARYHKSDKTTQEPEQPKLISYQLGDATLEAVCAVLGDNPRGLLQKRDELSGWLGGFDKYSDGNEAAQWLEFHSAGSLRIDRKGGEKRTIYIARAMVSVTGTIQEPILRKMLASDNAKHFDNGLVARFLMASPPERVRQWRDECTPPELVSKYVSLFEDLLSLSPNIDAETGHREPVILQFSPEAKAKVIAFVDANGLEMRAFKSDRLKSAWSKLEGQLMRLALVFHCVREAYLPSPDGREQTIAADTVDAALAWIEWLKGETRRIYDTLAYGEQSKLMGKLLAFVKRRGGRCTARDAARTGICGGQAKEVEALMSLLVEADLGEWETPEFPKGGRPTKVFRLKGYPQNGENANSTRETDETPAHE